MDFNEFWELLVKHLSDGLIAARALNEPYNIGNWAMAGRIRRRFIPVTSVRNDEIICLADNDNEEHVPRDSFEFLYERWDDYIARRINRKELRDDNHFTTYTIAITKHVKDIIGQL